jgi:hypothetical protein
MKYIFAVTLLLAFFPHIAMAKSGQEIIFDRYILKNTFYTAQLQLKAKRIFQKTFPNCNEKLAYVRLKPTVIVPAKYTVSDSLEDIQGLDFDSLHPSFGQWIEHARINACNNKTTINILVTASHQEQIPILFPLLNGTTRIEIKHQSTAEKIVNDAIVTNTNCSDPGIILGTEIIGYLTPQGNRLAETDQQAGWFEEWTVEACTESYDVNVAILTDPRTQYRYIAELKKDADSYEDKADD